MSEDRNRSRGDDAPQEREGAEPIATARPAESASPGPDARPAIGGNADGRDAALRSDTDRSAESPGGIRNSGAAGTDLPQAGMPDSGSPAGETSGEEGIEGSLGSGNYSNFGRVAGPDSPADERAGLRHPVEGAQGDDLANRLGGGEGRGIGMSGAGAATGDLSAGSSGPGEGEPKEDRAAALPRQESVASTGPGGPGGKSGATARTDASSRPPGGESPGRARERGD